MGKKFSLVGRALPPKMPRLCSMSLQTLSLAQLLHSLSLKIPAESKVQQKVLKKSS